MQSTIRLFKALPIETHETAVTIDDKVTKETLARGFVLAPEVIAAYQNFDHILTHINQAYGRGSEELNATFHKSFAKVRDASMQQLVFEQIIHYLTTYGTESLGIYNQESVFIPGERLEAPELKDGVRLVVIRGLTKAELRVDLMTLLGSGVAMHERTVADALDVATFVGFTEEDVRQVKNKEVKAALYDYFGFVPQQPVEFLRYVVFRATGKTLLIKNQALIDEIKAKQNLDVLRYFEIYEQQLGLQRLAEIFYRYKPIFLAFRTNTKLKQTINKVRRLARTHHQPMAEDLLNSVTARLAHRDGPDLAALTAALDKANTFRKIRLAYALKFRTAGAESILYRVRNGKSFATAFGFENRAGAEAAYGVVLAAITNDLAGNVRDKKVFIPQGVRYGVPATEKQFTGNLPTGTYVEVLEDMVCGIHWENQGSHRIDLDLSISNADGKIGWDGRYRDADQGVYFSGDMTDAPAPKGASELFHIGGRARGTWIMFANYYNFNKEVSVPFKIVVGSESKGNIEAHHTIDPNRIVAFSNAVIDVKQKNLGLIVATKESTKFYFAESSLGKSITSRRTDYAEHARTYLANYYTDTIVLNDLLVAAGAIMVEDPAEAHIDLSPEVVDRTTIINLFTPNVGESIAESRLAQVQPQ